MKQFIITLIVLSISVLTACSNEQPVSLVPEESQIHFDSVAEPIDGAFDLQPLVDNALNSIDTCMNQALTLTEESSEDERLEVADRCDFANLHAGILFNALGKVERHQTAICTHMFSAERNTEGISSAIATHDSNWLDNIGRITESYYEHSVPLLKDAVDEAGLEWQYQDTIASK